MMGDYLSVNGARLYFEVAGIGHPLVLIHAGILERGIRTARKVVVAGTAHLPNMERPAEFNDIVLDFLANIPSRNSSTTSHRGD